jgi:class 3 adenylate cyclase/tetratricopeptide (TPR) repeat protein
MACGARLWGDLRPDARKPATILFNDVTGSTALADRLEPEAVRQIMWRYYEAVSLVCERHGGTVEKFIGDAVMAVFGVPIAQEDHALRAVRAAAELREEIARLNEQLERDWGVVIKTRTGVNSGEVVTGDPAGGQALVTGDAVNVAARLEEAAAPGEILVGDTTRSLVSEAIEAEQVEPLSVKGKEAPLVAWRLIDVSSKIGQLERRLDSPLLGRERELEVLSKAFERARSERRAHCVTVLGAAGIGKSRLARELTSEASKEATVLLGSCLPYGEGITYWALAEIVRQVAGDQPRAGIARLLAGDPYSGPIADRIAQAIGLSDAGGDGRDLAWAVRRFFEALARRRPLLVVFEDIHWAEPPLLDLIEYLVTHAEDVPLTVVCLARAELLEERPEWGGDRPAMTTIALEPLPETAILALIESLRPDQVVEPSVSAELLARAEGNPLFVEQMIALMREEGGPGERITVPPTIQALLAARLDRLPVEELTVVGAASVVGTEFWSAAVSALSDPGAAPRLESALAKLVRKQMIRPGGITMIGEEGFSFRHALIREAAYESLTKASRADLHERFATWVEDGYPQRLSELEAILGYHLEQAYEYRAQLAPADDRARALAGRASARLGSAGRRSARAREDASAANLLSRAGALLPEEAHERLVMLPLIGQSLEGTANHAKAGEFYAEALERAVRAGDRGVEGRARLGRARVWFVAHPDIATEEIVAETNAAIEMLEEAEDERGLVEAWRLVGEALTYEGKAAEGQRALERALEHLGADASPRSLNAVSFAIGMCLLDGPAPLERAIEFADERLELARARALRSMEADMLHVLGAGEGRRGRFDAGRRALESSTAISEELGLAYMAQWSRRSLGRLELAAGDAQAAERALRSSYEALAETGTNSSLAEAAIPLAEALYAQGRHGEASRFLEAVKDEWASGDASVEAPRLALRAKLLAVEGWDRHAERTATRALRLVRKTDWACLQADTLLAQAEVLSLADRDRDALPSLREALAIAEAKQYEVVATAVRRRLEQLGEERVERVRR